MHDAYEEALELFLEPISDEQRINKQNLILEIEILLAVPRPPLQLISVIITENQVSNLIRFNNFSQLNEESPGLNGGLPLICFDNLSRD